MTSIKRAADFKKPFVQPTATRRRDEQNIIHKDRRKHFLSKRRKIEDDQDQSEWTEEQLQECIITFQQAENKEVLAALKQLRQLLSSFNPPIQIVIDTGLLEKLTQLLQIGNDEIKLEVVWCLTNIATGTHEQTACVLPTVPYLIELLQSDNYQLQEQVCWAIGNVAGDCDQFRSQLCANGVLLPLARLLNNNSCKRIAMWVISNLARGNAIPVQSFIHIGVIHHAIGILQDEAIEAISDTAWLFSFLTARTEETVNDLVLMGCIPLLSNWLQKAQHEVTILIPCLRSLGNLISASPEWTSLILSQANFIYSLVVLFNINQPRALTKEAAWVISNIAAGPKEHKQILISTNLLPPAYEILSSLQFDLQREVAFIFWNLASDSDFLPNILQFDIVHYFISFLKVSDLELVRCSLFFLHLILSHHPQGQEIIELADGIDVLENLVLTCPQEEIHVLADHILSQYFGDDYKGAHFNQGHEEISPPVESQFHPMGRGTNLTKPAWMK